MAVLQEGVQIAAANGYPADTELVKEQAQRFQQPGSTITSSMYRDMMAGAQVEADHILGDFLARAKAVESPLLKSAYVQLKIYEARLAAA